MNITQTTISKEVIYYKNQQGKELFAEWINSLKDKVIKARILHRIDRLKIGNYGDYKPVTKNIYELRLFFGKGYRIYFGKIDSNLILLLCGGNKKTQNKDIKKAKKYWEQYNE